MTVQELIEKLQTLPGNLPVYAGDFDHLYFEVKYAEAIPEDHEDASDGPFCAVSYYGVL